MPGRWCAPPSPAKLSVFQTCRAPHAAVRKRKRLRSLDAVLPLPATPRATTLAPVGSRFAAVDVMRRDRTPSRVMNLSGFFTHHRPAKHPESRRAEVARRGSGILGTVHFSRLITIMRADGVKTKGGALVPGCINWRMCGGGHWWITAAILPLPASGRADRLRGQFFHRLASSGDHVRRLRQRGTRIAAPADAESKTTEAAFGRESR